MALRDATTDDLDAILRIHNEAIATSLAIWMDEPDDLAERYRWFEEHAALAFPILVWDEDGAVVGYGTYSGWRARSGYRFTVEDSVYIDQSFHGRGIGRAIVTELIARARAQGMHSMLADIEASNTPSITLHESLGFVREGTLCQIGTKFGTWLDLAILRLPLE